VTVLLFHRLSWALPLVALLPLHINMYVCGHSNFVPRHLFLRLGVKMSAHAKKTTRLPMCSNARAHAHIHIHTEKESHSCFKYV